MNNVKYILKIALPLLLICAVTVAVLALVNSFTAPKIAENEKNELQKNMEVFYGENPVVTAIDHVDFDKSVKEAYIIQTSAGDCYCFDVTGSGAYKGTIEILVAFDTNGTIIGISNVKNSETPSIGGNVLQDSLFNEKFSGKTKSEVQSYVGSAFVSGATKTSTALNNAVKNAFEALEKASASKGANV